MDKRLVLLVFALSGMTVLIYEMVWVRPLQLIFGNTVYAISTMLAAFLAGFSIGSFLFGRNADDIKHPVKLFAKMQAFLGIYGILILFIFQALPFVYKFFINSPLFVPVQFLLTFVVILIPAIFMGAIWPLIAVLYIDEKDVTKDTGFIYSSNAIGSAIGPLLAGFILIPTLGVFGVAIFAALINLVIAFLFFTRVKEVNR